MNQVTIDQALELVVFWIGTTYAAGFSRDELAMQVLRKLNEGRHYPEIGVTRYGSWYCALYRNNDDSDPNQITAEAQDPRDTIIIAAGMWLQSQSKS